MSANVEAMVREGINAAKAGNKEEARALLMKATELDPYNEDGWLWLSGVVDSPEDQRTCLENVLAINPNHERARQGVAYLSGNTAAVAPRPVSPPPAPEVRTPTSVEWDMPATESSSSSAAPRSVPEPSAQEYDDWVERLNLTSSQPTVSPSSVPAFATPELFEELESPSGTPELDELEDFFSSGPFASPATTVEEPPPAPRTGQSFSFRQPPNFTTAAPARSPVPSAAPGSIPYSPVPEDGDDDFGLDADAAERFFPPEPKKKEKKTKVKVKKAPKEEPTEESELFGYIPGKIKATRLPGTRERTPILLVLAAIVLFVLNLGVATMLVLRLLTPA